MKQNRVLSILTLLAAFSLIFTFGCAGNKIANYADKQIAPPANYGAQESYGEPKKPVDILQEFGIEDGSRFTIKELRVLALIKDAKIFVKEKLGFKETQNFKRFDRAMKKTRMYYHLKRGPYPFSDQDYRSIHFVRKNYGSDEATEIAWLAGKKITKDKYDIWLYFPMAVSGDMPVHSALLKKDSFYIVGLVAHEDWHMTVSFPLHFEEATASLIEMAAPALFGYSKEKSLKEFERWMRCVEAINAAHDKISALAVQLEKKEITFEQYLSQREKYVRIAGKSQDGYPETEEFRLNVTKIVHLHTYTYYFPLAYRLYKSLDCDLIRFIRVLREMDERKDVHSPTSFNKNDRDRYFQEYREAEKRIEGYVEDIIQKALADKKKAQ